MREGLRSLPDLGRALGRVVAGRGSPRDLGQLRDGLGEARRIRDYLAGKPDRPALLEGLLPGLGGHGAPRNYCRCPHQVADMLHCRLHGNRVLRSAEPGAEGFSPMV